MNNPIHNDDQPGGAREEAGGPSPGRISFAAWFLIYQVVFLAVILLASPADSGFKRQFGPTGWLGTLAMAYVFGRIISVGLFYARARQNLAIMVFIFAYSMLNFYQLRSNTQLDPAVIADHWRNLDRGAARQVLLSALGPWDIYLSALFAFGAAMWVELIGRFARSLTSVRQFAAHCALYAALIFCVPVTGEQIGGLAGRSVVLRKARRDPLLLSGLTAPPQTSWPYYHTNQLYAHKLGLREPRPSVFLVTLESFSAGYVEKTTADGREYTPNLNRAIRSGIYFERYFANAAYTIKSQESILGGIPPTAVGEANNYWRESRVAGLPTILRQHGYQTAFLSAHVDAKFANTDVVMKKLGFNYIAAADKLARPADRDYFWGWGLQDDKFFAAAFAALDGATNRARGQPLFANFATISHHIPFAIPASERQLFPRPRNRRENFANSINAADRYLKSFFEELGKRPEFANSLVILTGDHGYPSGEHGRFLNNVLAYNELFSVPLLILWPGKLQPARVRTPASHLNLAPTIIDLLNIATATHFAARSLFDPGQVTERQPLVQTYDGGYVGIIEYPWKYLIHLASGASFLFDLENDPLETIDRVNDPQEGSRVARLKEEVARILSVQRLIAADRLLPGDRAATVD